MVVVITLAEYVFPILLYPVFFLNLPCCACHITCLCCVFYALYLGCVLPIPVLERFANSSRIVREPIKRGFSEEYAALLEPFVEEKKGSIWYTGYQFMTISRFMIIISINSCCLCADTSWSQLLFCAATGARRTVERSAAIFAAAEKRVAPVFSSATKTKF